MSFEHTTIFCELQLTTLGNSLLCVIYFDLFFFSLPNELIVFAWSCICRKFYGPGESYTMFAGKESSRSLALLSFKPQDINGI